MLNAFDIVIGIRFNALACAVALKVTATCERHAMALHADVLPHHPQL
jgi:hypothetical protein